MNRRCPHCGESFRENPALHVEVPYLAGPNERTVSYCVEASRHVHIPTSWVEDLLSSVARIRRLTRFLRRFS